jgi:predicted pyridoxine 5'-phosphate oxidase superfamily flavin-nucleotide-binding protein
MNYLSYHEGEREVQSRAGVASDGLAAEDMYRSAMGLGVQRFLSAQNLAVLSTMDADGRVWASLRAGAAGFLRVVDEHIVEVGGHSHPDDPLLQNLKQLSSAGMLVINLAARQRLRLNGTGQIEDGIVRLTVNQVYGNCPQYIQAREAIPPSNGPSKSVEAKHREGLDDRLREWIASADTFFIATAHPESGLDASHRGGKPGFVRIEDSTHLIFPDYPGNNMFNSLGNITAYPKAGLLFPDFEGHSVLQLSGAAKILWDDPRAADFTQARRLVEFKIEKAIELPDSIPLGFEFRSYSPHLR